MILYKESLVFSFYFCMEFYFYTTNQFEND